MFNNLLQLNYAMGPACSLGIWIGLWKIELLLHLALSSILDTTKLILFFQKLFFYFVHFQLNTRLSRLISHFFTNIIFTQVSVLYIPSHIFEL